MVPVDNTGDSRGWGLTLGRVNMLPKMESLELPIAQRQDIATKVMMSSALAPYKSELRPPRHRTTFGDAYYASDFRTSAIHRRAAVQRPVNNTNCSASKSLLQPVWPSNHCVVLASFLRSDSGLLLVRGHSTFYSVTSK